MPWPERWPGEIDVFAAARGLIKVDDQIRDRARSNRGQLLASVQRHAAEIKWFLDRAEAGRR